MSSRGGNRSSAGPTRSGAAARSRRPAASRPAGPRGGPTPRVKVAAVDGPEAHRPPRSRLLRQAIGLGVVLVVVAALIAFPLRNYLDRKAALEAELVKQEQLTEQLADLQEQRAALDDPDYIKAQARDRLQYVEPGDVAYVVHAPDPPVPAPAGEPAGPSAERPWFEDLWDGLQEPPP